MVVVTVFLSNDARCAQIPENRHNPGIIHRPAIGRSPDRWTRMLISQCHCLLLMMDYWMFGDLAAASAMSVAFNDCFSFNSPRFLRDYIDLISLTGVAVFERLANQTL
jgi:hypothetical protein